MSILTAPARLLASWLLPQDCFICGQASGDATLCPECDGALPSLPADRCPICAVPTPAAAVCGTCLKTPPHFDATHALYAYAFPVEELVQALKYGHALAPASFLGERLAQAMDGLEFHCIAPLPLHPKRLAQRGFNQSVELARPLARRRDLPLLLHEVKREIDNPPQAALAWAERRKNVHGAFHCETRLDGKTILVIDDVMTTGATLNEFARCLKKHGAAKVINGVVARTLPDHGGR